MYEGFICDDKETKKLQILKRPQVHSFVMTDKQTNRQTDKQTYKFENEFLRGEKTMKISFYNLNVSFVMTNRQTDKQTNKQNE